MKLLYVIIVLSLFILILLTKNVYPQKSITEMQLQIEKIVRESQISQSSTIGLFIKVLKSDETVFSKNADIPLVPSSNLKVLTTAAAFTYLGANYKYRTTVYGSPIEPERGTMNSSLYLVGSGDPSFVEPFIDSPTKIFEEFAKRLYAMGLRKIKGDLVGDDSIFDRDFIGKGWKTRYILDTYASECGGLTLNGNLLQIMVEPNKASIIPSSPSIKVINKTTSTGYNNVKITRETKDDAICVSGTIPYGAPLCNTITVHNPPLFATSSFGKILLDYGIFISGRVKLIEPNFCKYSYKNFIPLCVYESPRIYEIMKRLNKESDNFLAQQIFKTLGAVVKGKGTLKNSEDVIKDLFNRAGIDSKGLHMADGCGLSNFNRVTPRQLVGVLDYMYYHPEGKLFISTLPHAGVDGTLRYRLSGTNVFAKTGTINENSSLSGYVKTEFGQTLVFSIISNNHKLSQGYYKDFEDRIVSLIAKWKKEL